MGLLSSALKTIGANTLTKFTTAVNNSISEAINSQFYGTNITKGAVNLKLSNGNGGISHAVDLKKRMQNIEWSRGFSWDVHISPSPPAPFNDASYGLPVVDVDNSYTMIGNMGYLDLSGTNYQFPQRKDLFGIKLTMLDDEKGTMEQYFENWMNQIYLWNDDGGHTGYLDESVRVLTLAKLTSTKHEIFRREYLVFPQQGVTSPNNSTGNVRQISIDLMVAGYNGKNIYKSVSKPNTAQPEPSTNLVTNYGTMIDAVRAKTTPTSVGSDRWNSYTTQSELPILGYKPPRTLSDEISYQTGGTPESIWGWE